MPAIEIVQEDLVPGLVVGQSYRLEQVLGEGGMGVVWAAAHVRTQKRYALKFLKGARAEDPKSHERLLREARSLLKIVHANVAEVHDILELDCGVPFLVMELIEGETLAAHLLRAKRLELREACALALPVVDALEAAHAVGVVHRDVKPENIFVGKDDDGTMKVRLFDFGIAKSLEAEAPALTTTGDLVGTSFYMAPEQVFGERDVDARADIWGLGLVLYEMLSGVLPTRRDVVGQVIKAVTLEPIPPIEGVPLPLRTLVMSMLSRDRTVRPSLAEVRAVLAPIAAGLTLPPARRPNWRWLGLVGVTAAGALALGFAGRTGKTPLPQGEPVVTASMAGGELSPESQANTITAEPASSVVVVSAPASAKPAANPRLTPPTPPRAADKDAGSSAPVIQPAPQPTASSGTILAHERK